MEDDRFNLKLNAGPVQRSRDEFELIWRTVDQRSSQLSAAAQVAVRNAIATAILQGRPPVPEQIDLLIAFAAGKISMPEYFLFASFYRDKNS